MFHQRKPTKRLTKEDAIYGNIHKMIWLLALLVHYIYRFNEWYKYGHMIFDGSFFTLSCILLHAVLSATSMILHLPADPMISPEFRVQNIIFAMRSLIIMIFHWVYLRYPEAYIILDFRSMVILVTMFLADEVTMRHPPQGSTTRVMPYPHYVPMRMRNAMNFFYAVCQVYATLEVLTRPYMSYVFMVLFPIQISAFLMTCVRKSIITAGGWHLWYSLSLILVIVHSQTNNHILSMTNNGLLMYHASAAFFVIMRFMFHVNKYFLWSAIIMVLCSKPRGIL